ncbi:AfsR/SARP family transcriptional regulator [Streptomyces sp. SHP 1-2]|nr:AfsR/SARP family transcriptional regulator [Streptomyces sp. SHP 1-2]
MATGGAPLRIQLLGPVRAWRNGAEVALGPPKQRAVLALLASRANDVVGVESIVDALWGCDMPQTAVNGVHTYVSGLRRALEPGRPRGAAGSVLTSEPGGYCLRLDPADVDAALFTRVHGDARRLRGEGAAEEALRLYERALSLWRGEAYAGVPGPFAAMGRTRLRDLRLTAVEEWAAGLLEAGRPAEPVAELTGAVADEPLREKLRWLLILALYRSGRQAHALRVYEETRRLLSTELGIEPGAELRSLHRRILSGQPEQPDRPEPGEVPGDHRPAAPRDPVHDVPRPFQLPPLARGFTGRVMELALLEKMLDEETAHHAATTPVAVVDGAGGVGKTALVLELAHRLVDRYPDGALYVDLRATGQRSRPMSAAEALAQLLGGLGVDASRLPAETAARATLYRSLLHGRRMLVVLDDADSADQLRPLIPRGTSCVLVTGRRRLAGLAARDGAHLVTVGPLADEASARLLVGLSGGRLDGQDRATARLVALCGGLPLALRVVADGLAARPEVPLGVLVDQYTEEGGRLDRLMVHDDAAASLRCVFETSYAALPADAARMFRYLGLHRGPFTARTAATLAATDRVATGRLLSVLVSHHLLQEEAGHQYRFHPLVGAYAAECALREPPAHRQEALDRLRTGSVDPYPWLLSGDGGWQNICAAAL